jgi:hypothetical protein
MAFSTQPAQHFGAVLTGILPSKAAKQGSQKSEGKPTPLIFPTYPNSKHQTLFDKGPQSPSA